MDEKAFKQQVDGLKEFSRTPGLELDMGNVPLIEDKLRETDELLTEVKTLECSRQKRFRFKEALLAIQAMLKTVRNILTGKVGAFPSFGDERQRRYDAAILYGVFGDTA